MQSLHSSFQRSHTQSYDSWTLRRKRHIYFTQLSFSILVWSLSWHGLVYNSRFAPIPPSCPWCLSEELVTAGVKTKLPPGWQHEDDSKSWIPGLSAQTQPPPQWFPIFHPVLQVLFLIRPCCLMPLCPCTCISSFFSLSSSETHLDLWQWGTILQSLSPDVALCLSVWISLFLQGPCIILLKFKRLQIVYRDFYLIKIKRMLSFTFV